MASFYIPLSRSLTRRKGLSVKTGQIVAERLKASGRKNLYIGFSSVFMTRWENIRIVEELLENYMDMKVLCHVFFSSFYTR